MGDSLPPLVKPDEESFITDFLLLCRAAPGMWLRCKYAVTAEQAKRITDGDWEYCTNKPYEVKARMAERGRTKVLFARYTGRSADTAADGHVASDLRQIVILARGQESLSYIPLDELIFQDPIPSRFMGGSINQWLDQCRNFPHTWIVRKNCHSAAASLIRHGQAYGCRRGDWVAANRSRPGLDRNKYDLYVMYVGPAIDYADPDDSGLEFADPENRPDLDETGRVIPKVLIGGKSPITAWLNNVVRQTDNWCKYPRPVTKNQLGRIRAGTMYSAKPNEFEIYVTPPTGDETTRRITVRKNPDYVPVVPRVAPAPEPAVELTPGQIRYLAERGGVLDQMRETPAEGKDTSEWGHYDIFKGYKYSSPAVQAFGTWLIGLCGVPPATPDNDRWEPFPGMMPPEKAFAALKAGTLPFSDTNCYPVDAFEFRVQEIPGQGEQLWGRKSQDQP